jgi:L-2-hydroxycarboxylate dehydrogenase (NAD+)
LPVIAARVERGLVSSRPPVITSETVATVDVDGRACLGPVAGWAATTAVIEMAPRTGIALATVHDCGHLGMLAPYVEAIAAHDLLGIAMTTSEALVHAPGGAKAMIGTNPLAVCVPALPEPFLLDMATGTVSMGQILEYEHLGKPLEPGWAIDARGAPTLDATAAKNGAISPFGGFKGYGLGLAIELLVVALTGSAIGREVSGTLDTDRPCNKGDLFLAIAPAQRATRWPETINDYLRDLRAGLTAEDAGVAIPGDRSRELRKRRLRDGLNIPDPVWARIRSLVDAPITRAG